MRTLLLIVLAAATALSVAACGSGETAAQASEKPQAETAEVPAGTHPTPEACLEAITAAYDMKDAAFEISQHAIDSMQALNKNAYGRFNDVTFPKFDKAADRFYAAAERFDASAEEC